MRRLFLLFLSGAALFVLAACVAPTTTSQSVLSLPQPPAGYGRVYFYRLGDIVGAWITPNVLMNNRVVGQAVAGRYFYINVPPGQYIVASASDPGRQVRFSTGPGTKVYVRLNNVFAGIQQVYPELVNEFEGLSQMQPLGYGG